MWKDKPMTYSIVDLRIDDLHQYMQTGTPSKALIRTCREGIKAASD
jgi:hypothetical protein